MCGRFSNTLTWREIVALYGVTSLPPASNLQPNYNAAPTQRLPIVRAANSGRECIIARWGLIPLWTRDLAEMKLTTINARAETVATSRLYKRPFATQRCIVPATGWYEWQKVGTVKQPYAIRVKDQPFGFAGLWDVWHGPEGDVENFTIVTTDAAPALTAIHNRMPHVLTPDQFGTWLDADAVAGAKLLKPSNAQFETWKVGRAVGTVRNNGPELLKPI